MRSVPSIHYLVLLTVLLFDILPIRLLQSPLTEVENKTSFEYDGVV